MAKRTNRFQETNGQREHFQGAALGTLGFCTRWAVNRQGTGPEWIEIIQIDLSLDRLPHRLSGLRIAQISDLHFGNTVSRPYLERCIERVNRLNADILVLTGDYITFDFRGRYRRKIIPLLSRLRSRLGVFACLGNHDYGIHAPRRQRPSLLSQLLDGMGRGGVRVLRNESVVVEVNGHPFWIAGLGDLWANDFLPQKTFAQVPAGETTLGLVHNPRGVDYLRGYPVKAILSGHTHGSRLAYRPRSPWKVRRRRYQAGLYEVGDMKLYVNRGLGRMGRARFHSRPEITLFTLR